MADLTITSTSVTDNLLPMIGEGGGPTSSLTGFQDAHIVGIAVSN